MKKILYFSSACVFFGMTGLTAAPALTATPQTSSRTAIAQTLPMNSPSVELINPGIGNRRQLSLRPQVNTDQTATVTVFLDVANTVAGEPVSRIRLPETVFNKQVSVTDVAANGNIEAQYSYTAADVVPQRNIQPQVLKEMRRVIQQMATLRGTTTLNPRGEITTGNINLPTNLDSAAQEYLQQLSKSLYQMSLPFPEEAVGVGAKWRVISEMNVNGVNLNQVVTYDLVHLEDNVATFDVNVVNSAVPTTVTLAGVASPVNLKSLNTQGQGRIIMRLDRVMPIASAMAINSNVDLTVIPAGTNQEIPIQRSLYMNIFLEDTETPIAQLNLPKLPTFKDSFDYAAKPKQGVVETAALGAGTAALSGALFGDSVNLGNVATGAAVGAGIGLLF